MSPTFRNSEVDQLIDKYKAGELTLDALAQCFRASRWPTVERQQPQSYMEMAARAQEDPDPWVPGSWDDVAAAYFRHDLTTEEYRVLKAAALEAGRAEDRGEL